MKKIFTLLFALGMFAAAHAQPGNRDNRQTDHRTDQRDDDDRFDNERNVVVNHNPYNNNDDRFGNSHFSNERRMRTQIARINREFDYKKERVRNNFYMSRWEKQRQIRFLEEQRQREIRKVYLRFKYNRGYHDRDFPDRRSY
jgi:hypothetical protein